MDLRELTTYVHKRLLHKMFTTALFWESRLKTDVHQQMSGLKKCDVFIQWNTIQQQTNKLLIHKKTQIKAFSKWKKQDAKETILYDLYEPPRQTKLI